jgi:hypothetical protein
LRAGGKTSYYGGGILARYNLQSAFLSGLYFDASGCIGRADADFRTDDIRYNSWKANFETSSSYYGLHGRLGYVWLIPGLDDKASLARLIFLKRSVSYNQGLH